MFRKFRRSKVVAAIALAVAGINASHAQTTEGPATRIIVKWKAPELMIGVPRAGATTQAAQEQARAEVISRSLNTASARVGANLQRVRVIATGAESVRIDRRLTREELATVINDLAADPNVEYVEEDRLLRPSLTPNDARYNEQWHYFNSTSGLRLPAAWDRTTGSGVVVAVIDTGYRPHADLAANIVGGYDFISDTFIANDGNGRDNNAQDPGDWNTAGQCPPDPGAYSSSWHGTHVAGTVAAVSNNGSGVAGVAFGARVLPLRVLGRCGGLTSDIADAIVWASGGGVSGVPSNTNVAKVINLSLGSPPGYSCDNTTQAAINSARSRGSVVVVAAGNDNVNASQVTPANCGGVIAVSATNRSGGKSYYSNYGAVVDVGAPGGDVRSGSSGGILSTLNSGSSTPGSDTYAYYQGTSMAAPHVAGVAALMFSVNNTLTPDQVESFLRSSARPFPSTCSQCGTGLVDANAAVAAAANGSGGNPPPSVCPAGYSEYRGNLSSRGSAYLPTSSGYTSSVSGVHSGRLTGPSTADFDLFLQRRSGTYWSTVSRSESYTSTESIDYNGTSGSYRWRVYSYSGSGAFTFCARRP